MVVSDQNTLGPAGFAEGCLEPWAIVGSLATETLVGVDRDQLGATAGRPGPESGSLGC